MGKAKVRGDAVRRESITYREDNSEYETGNSHSGSKVATRVRWISIWVGLR